VYIRRSHLKTILKSCLTLRRRGHQLTPTSGASLYSWTSPNEASTWYCSVPAMSPCSSPGSGLKSHPTKKCARGMGVEGLKRTPWKQMVGRRMADPSSTGPRLSGRRLPRLTNLNGVVRSERPQIPKPPQVPNSQYCRPLGYLRTTQSKITCPIPTLRRGDFCDMGASKSAHRLFH
jgi:hypothetical protein